jgi:uncharacterized protein (TIGR03437 family)
MRFELLYKRGGFTGGERNAADGVDGDTDPGRIRDRNARRGQRYRQRGGPALGWNITTVCVAAQIAMRWRGLGALLIWSALACAQPGPLITTIAGTGQPVFNGDGRPANTVSLSSVWGVAADTAGNVYTTAEDNLVIKITPDGVLHVIAGNGISGDSGDGGSATAAALNFVQKIAVDNAGVVYAAQGDGTIRTIQPNGTIGTFPVSGAPNISVNAPALAAGSDGSLYIADTGLVRRVFPNGSVQAVVGRGDTCNVGELPVTPCGSIDGQPALSVSPQIYAIALNPAGVLYLAEPALNRVDYLGTDGLIHTLPQSFQGPWAIAFDAVGNLYVSESPGISMVSAAGEKNWVTFQPNPSIAGNLALDGKGNIYYSIQNAWLGGEIGMFSAGSASIIAGVSAPPDAHDGGLAVNGQLDAPMGVAVGPNGNVYIADTYNNRIREIAGGVISTYAGNGYYSLAGDGGPASHASLTWPEALAFDRAGNLYAADLFSVRKISPVGMISTVNTGLNAPCSVVADSLGNLYVGDGNVHVVNRISLSGTITPFAGTGQQWNPAGPASGPATSLSLSSPCSLAVDGRDNIYIADYNGPNRILQVTPAGSAITVANINGLPVAIAVDPLGNLYFSDLVHYKINRLNADGTVTTVAGNGADGFSGDGGLARQAAMTVAYGIGFDAAGNLLIADTWNDRVREVSSAPPVVSATPVTLTLQGNSGGNVATATFSLAAQLGYSNATPLPGLAYTTSTNPSDSWLAVMPRSGNTPALISVSGNPLSLAQGTYAGAITLGFPTAALPSLSVTVQVSVGAAVPASLAVDHTHLSFTYSTTSAARVQTITVSNTGSGSLPFSVTATENSGRSVNWLSVTPKSATATPSTPAVLSVQTNPSNLPAGTYSGTVAIASTAGTATVSLTMTISANPLIMLLSQTGLTFTAVQNGGPVPPQTFSVLSLGSGTLNWTARTSVLGGVNNWLSVTPNSGVSAPGSSNTSPAVSVSVNPAGLAPGIYYGLVTVTAAGAANTPQGVVAVVQVLPAGTDLAPVVQPNSLVFTGTVGNSSPSSQNVLVYDPTGTNKSFRSGIVTVNGGSWLETLPGDATIPANQAVSIVVQPVVNNLAAGTYQGTLTLQFSDGRVSSVPVQFIVTGGGSSLSSDARGGKPAEASQGCVPATLSPSVITLGPRFSVPAGYPQGLEAQVVDNCGNPQVDGTVYVSFTNGDAPVKLQSLGNGVWDGTWPVGQTAQAVTLTVAAKNGAGTSGQSTLNGGLSATMPAPKVYDGGVVNAASVAVGVPVAPGELISIFGQQLSGGELSAGSGMLPTTLSGVQVLIGSQTGVPGGEFQASPLLFTSGGQVNAEVSFNANVNTNQQVLLQWGTAYAPPVYVDVGAASPGVFQTTGQQGIITDASGNPIVPSNPAHAGDVVVIYCTGLGAVTPSIGDGQPTPPAYFMVQNPVTVTMGGQNATVQFAGLTPGFNGLYQINVTVPLGITAGDQVPVSVISAGQTSAWVVTSIR